MHIVSDIETVRVVKTVQIITNIYSVSHNGIQLMRSKFLMVMVQSIQAISIVLQYIFGIETIIGDADGDQAIWIGD